MDMIAISRWDEERGEPAAEALSCADLLHDQSGKHLAVTLKRATDAAGLDPAGCTVAPMTDGASACSGEIGESQLYINKLRELAAQSQFALVHSAPKESCAIHAKALEELHGLEAAFPGHTLESFTRLIWECFSRKCGYATEFKKIWCEDCKLPGVMYDACLGSLPEPTEAKWQVMFDVCMKLLPLFAVAPGQQGLAGWMFEVFLKRLLELLRGTIDEERPDLAGTHNCKDKISMIAGLVAELNLVAACMLTVDFWEQNCLTFHKVMRAKSRFGAFASPHLRHEMAVNVCVDTVWYAKANADPKAALPRFHAFIARCHVRAFSAQMTSQKREQLTERAQAFLKEAEASHLKWNATTWTKARHLLGVLTDTKRGGWFAAHLLKLLGAGEQLGAAAAAQCSSSSSSSAGDATAAGTAAHPSDAVDVLLLQLLQVKKASGELEQEIEVWGLRRPKVLDELRLIATTAVATEGASSVVSKERTPLLFGQLRDRLFVGFAHNLFLESLVSRLSMLEKRHPRTHALTLDTLFKYHMKQLRSREQRQMSSVRSDKGGGLREKAREAREEEKKLHGCNRTLAQQLLLAEDALACARRYTAKAAPELLWRKSRGVTQGVRQLSAAYVENMQAVAAVKVESLRKTNEAGPSRQRKAALTLQACRTLVAPQAPAYAKVKKGRGCIHKDPAGLKLRKAQMRARIKEAKARAAATRRKRPLSEAGRRRLEAREAPAARQQPRKGTKRTRASLAELEAQAHNRRQRGTGGRQRADSAGAGGSSQENARKERVEPAAEEPLQLQLENGARPSSADEEPEAQAAQHRQPSRRTSAGSSGQEGADSVAQEQLMHRQAAAVALRISRAHEEALQVAQQVAEASMEAAQAQAKAAQEQMARAHELKAVADLQEAEMKAAEEEYKVLRAALFKFKDNFQKKRGRKLKKSDTLEYEHRKCAERYKLLKEKHPNLGNKA